MTRFKHLLLLTSQTSINTNKGFPGSSAGKESTCNAGDPGSIPGSGRSAGEGIGYPLQYSWAALVAQLVKNPPAMQETYVWSLGWEDPLEKGMATHCSILAWRSQRVGHNWATFTFTYKLWASLGHQFFLFEKIKTSKTAPCMYLQY